MLWLLYYVSFLLGFMRRLSYAVDEPVTGGVLFECCEYGIVGLCVAGLVHWVAVAFGVAG